MNAHHIRREYSIAKPGRARGDYKKLLFKAYFELFIEGGGG